MNIFLTALAPVILIVALGQLIAARNWVPQEAFRAMDRLSFLILLPALIIRALANAEFDSAPWQMVVTVVAAQIILGGIGLLAHFWPGGMHRPSIGSIIQSNVRWNTIIALSLGAILFGDEGVALVSLVAAVMIPAANILSVYALTSHADRPPGTKPRPFLAMTRNPMVIACLIGILLAAFHIEIPGIIDETMKILANAAIAAGLLSAGAGVDLKALTRAGVRTFTWSVIRLFALPAIVLGIGLTVGLTGLPLAIALLCAATPTAPNAYVLARELGGDTTLTANLIAVQIILAIFTLPLTWALILWLGAV